MSRREWIKVDGSVSEPLTHTPLLFLFIFHVLSCMISNSLPLPPCLARLLPPSPLVSSSFWLTSPITFAQSFTHPPPSLHFLHPHSCLLRPVTSTSTHLCPSVTLRPAGGRPGDPVPCAALAETTRRTVTVALLAVDEASAGAPLPPLTLRVAEAGG